MPDSRITGKVDPEEVLRLTEAFGDIGFWRVNIADNSVYWSDKVFAIHGIDPAEGEPPLAEAINFYHPDDVPMVEAAVARATQSGTPFDFRGARIIQRGGGERHVLSRGEVKVDANGQPTEIYGIFQDITDQVRAQKVAAEAQARMALVVQSGLGIWDYDVTKETVLISPELGAILGFDYSGPVAVSMDDFLSGIPKDDRSRIRAALDAHITSDAPYLIEHRARHQDGSTIWLRSRGLAERDRDGRTIRVVGSVEDITPVRRSAEALSEANSRFDLAVRGASVGIWEVSLPDGDMYVSDRLKEIVGAPVTPAKDKDRFIWNLDVFLSNIHEEDRDRMRAAIEDHLAGGAAFEQQYRFRHTETGEFIHVLLRAQAEWDEDGVPIRMAGSLEDVSERVADIEALRMSEIRFKLAADGASVGIWDWLNVDEDVEYWSPNFYRLLGYQPGEMKASIETFQRLLHPDDSDATFAALTRHYENRTPFHVEYRLRHKSGGYRWFLGTGQAAFNEDGKPVRMVGSIQDIHDRKVAEQRLITANEDLDQFASVASHDLQEPLRKVAQFSALLEREYGDLLEGNGVTYLHFLIDGASRMSRLVRDLLTYSRMGEAALDVEAVSIGGVIADVLTDVSESIRESGAVVKFDENASVLADRELLRRLLQNLISNSIKYRSEATPHITVSVKEESDSTLLIVEDNGSGFDQAQAERVFEIFRRLHRKETHSGTGLGLAICKRIADMHEGKIWAESEVGKGSRFITRLPGLVRDAVSRVA